VRLSDGTELSVDRIVCATGYKADVGRVPYLAGVLDRIQVADGFPVLDETFQTSLPGLYLPGFTATRDFGPFFGFTKGCPAAAELVTRGLTQRLSGTAACRASATTSLPAASQATGAAAKDQLPLHRLISGRLMQDLDVPVRCMHADPLPIPDQPGGMLHPHDGRQAVLPCDHRAMGH